MSNIKNIQYTIKEEKFSDCTKKCYALLYIEYNDETPSKWINLKTFFGDIFENEYYDTYDEASIMINNYKSWNTDGVIKVSVSNHFL